MILVMDPDLTGLNTRAVCFMPDDLKRPDSYRTKADTGTSVVIELEKPSKLPFCQAEGRA